MRTLTNEREKNLIKNKNTLMPKDSRDSQTFGPFHLFDRIQTQHKKKSYDLKLIIV